MKVLYFILIFFLILLACKSLSIRDKLDLRTEENMKLTAFTIAKNYLLSFTPYKKSNVALANREKESNSNNY